MDNQSSSPTILSPSKADVALISRTIDLTSNSIESPKQLREMIRKQKKWGCTMCLSRRNISTSTVCSTCGSPKPVTRIGLLSEHGVFFLCKTDTSTALPTVSIFCVSGKSEEAVVAMKLSAHHHKVILPMRGEKTVEECCREAIENLVSYSNPEDDQYDSYESHKDKMLHDKKAQNYLNENGIESTSALGPEWVRDESKTLFAQVMENAKEISYDANIGRYLHKAVAAQMEDKEKLHENMNYTRFMQREKVEMGKNVNEILKRRNNLDIYNDFEPPGRDEERHHCSLCEITFPMSQLLASVTFKAIADWREKRNVPFPSNDIRLCAVRVHDKALLCLFCTQFFDKDFSDVIDESEIEDSVGFGKSSGIEGGFHYSNKTYKRIMKKMIEKQEQLDDRPLSRMKLKISIDRLKFKAESGNSNLRYQYNPQALKRDLSKPIVDQAKGGRLLRDKYTDLGVLISEQKKGLTAEMKDLRLHLAAADKSVIKARKQTITGTVSTTSLPTIEKENLKRSKSADLPKSLTDDKSITTTKSMNSTGKSLSSKRKKIKKKRKQKKAMKEGQENESVVLNDDRSSVASMTSKSSKKAPGVRKPLIVIVPDKESKTGQKRLEAGAMKFINKNTVDVNSSPVKKLTNKKVNFGDSIDSGSIAKPVVKFAFGQRVIVKSPPPPPTTEKLIPKEKKLNWKQKIQKEAESRQVKKVQTLDGLSKIGKTISDFSGQNQKQVKALSKAADKSKKIKAVTMPVKPVEYEIEPDEYEDYYDGDFEVLDNSESKQIVSIPLWGGESLQLEEEVEDYIEDFSMETYAWATKDILKQDSSRNDIYTPTEDDPRLASLRLLSRGSTRSTNRSLTPKPRKADDKVNKMHLLSSGPQPATFKMPVNKKIHKLRASN